jgi:hypothetical protein
MVNFKEMLKISFEAVLVNYCMITQRVQLYLEMTHPKLLKHFPRFEHNLKFYKYAIVLKFLTTT